MSRPLVVLRPASGNAATARAAAERGLATICLPLFAVTPLPWRMPPGTFDGLLLTSANAPRHGGGQLAALRRLPVVAVGEATAAAARAAGLAVVLTGHADVARLLTTAAAAGYRNLLHLAGRDRRLHAEGIVAAVAAVYASEPIAPPADALAQLVGSVALLHSPRAARRFAELVAPTARARIALACLSAAVAEAAGPGWQALAVTPEPTDARLLDAAAVLAG